MPELVHQVFCAVDFAQPADRTVGAATRQEDPSIGRDAEVTGLLQRADPRLAGGIARRIDREIHLDLLAIRRGSGSPESAGPAARQRVVLRPFSPRHGERGKAGRRHRDLDALSVTGDPSGEAHGSVPREQVEAAVRIQHSLTAADHALPASGDRPERQSVLRVHGHPDQRIFGTRRCR